MESHTVQGFADQDDAMCPECRCLLIYDGREVYCPNCGLVVNDRPASLSLELKDVIRLRSMPPL